MLVNLSLQNKNIHLKISALGFMRPWRAQCHLVKFGFVFLRDYLNNGSTFEERTNPCKTRCKKSLWVISVLLISGVSGGLTLYGFRENDQIEEERATSDKEGLALYSVIKGECSELFNNSNSEAINHPFAVADGLAIVSRLSKRCVH